VSSSGGLLDVVLTLEAASVAIDSMALGIFTLNGTLPGPTLRIKAGDRVRILFKNLLPAQPNARRQHNEFGYVDESNLHFHGLHVPGDLPSDDTKLVVGPGGEFQYETVLPQYHMPGTNWIHPHRHGSSALQVGGAAALALIVDDPPGSLPNEVANAEEVLLVVQDLALQELSRIAQRSGDSLVWSAPAGNPPDLLVINGEHMPEIAATPGQWQRWRVIFAGWRNVGRSALNLAVDGCTMQLLAKDGMYISDFPRSIQLAPIPAGGRADVMVKCPSPSSRYRVTSGETLIGYVDTSAVQVSSSELSSWSPVLPDYMQDLQTTPASEGCSCETEVEEASINGVPFSEDTLLHETFLGAVVERKIETGGHPYHQHFYPFQLVDGFRSSDFFHLGDWHDTFMSDGLTREPLTVRYKTTFIAGEMMLHCHRLDHEDRGSMAFETISPTGSTCSCSGRALDTGNIVIIAVAVSSAVCVVITVLGFCFWRRRSQRRSDVGPE